MFSGSSLFFPKRAIASGTPVAAQSLTVGTVAVTPTGYTNQVAGGGGVLLVTFDIQVSDVRVRLDGTAPTGTVGTILAVGTNYTWSVDLFNNAQFIRISTASSDAIIFAHALNV